MIVRGRDFTDIYDLVGIRILVDTVRDCYAALGVIHANWQPVPGRFKDYIAMPKFNMYQSLHTTVIGPDGKPVEMQIRTLRDAPHRRVRHRRALEVQGDQGRRRSSARRPHIDEMTWLRQLLDWQREAQPTRASSSTRCASTCPARRSTSSRPKGDVIALPAGLDPGRLRLRGAHRGRAPVHRRPGQRQAGAAGVARWPTATWSRSSPRSPRPPARPRTGWPSSSARGRGPRSGSGSTRSAARTRSRPARTRSSRRCASRACRCSGCSAATR